MNKIINLFILVFSLFNLANSELNIKSLSTNMIEKSFSSKIDIHNIDVEVELPENITSNQVMLHIEFIELPYDRLTPEDGYKYCLNHEGLIVRDWSYQESFYYSCCVNKFNNTYNCPIPPADTNTNPFRTFLYGDFNNVYIKLVDKNSKWVKTNEVITYVYPNNFSGILRRLLIISLIITLSLIATNSLLGMINLGSNQYPFLTTNIHIFSTIFGIIGLYLILSLANEDNSIRGYYVRTGLRFAIITLIYSLFIIYIPNKYESNEANSVEQRIILSDNKYVSKFILFFKKIYVKNCITVLFTCLTVLQIWSVYSIIEALKEYYDFEWELLVAVVIWYSILNIIFLVAFITAIFNVKIPVKFNRDTGEMVQYIKKTKYKKLLFNNKVSCLNNNNMMGICDIESINNFDYDKINVGDLMAIDCDLQNHTNPYSFLLWKIGYIENNDIILNNEFINKRVKYNFFKKKYGLIELNLRNIKDNIMVYKVVKLDNKNEHKYVEFGVIKNGYLIQEHVFLLNFINLIFKILPEYSEDYNYNVVENLRDEWLYLTKNLGNKYGIIYWILFIITTVYIIIFEINNSVSILNISLIFVMIIFCMIVNFKIVKKQKLFREKNYNNLLKLSASNKRGDDNLGNYTMNYKNYSFQNNSCNKVEYDKFNDLNFYTLKLQDGFIYKITINSFGSILGIGINNNDNNDIFNILKPSIWFNNKNDEVGFRYNDNINWQNIKTILPFNIYCGSYKNNFFIFVNNKSYLISSNNNNLLICKETNDKPIIGYYKYINKSNNIYYLSEKYNEYQKSIDFKFDNNNFILNYSNNWNFHIDMAMIGQNNNLWSYTNNKITMLNDKMPLLVRNGFTFVFNDIKFNKTKINDIEFEIDILESGINFIAIGLIDENKIMFNDFYNKVPGWPGTNSIGYHSDDGSICISNEIENTYYDDSDLKYDINNNIKLRVGFDGIDIYFTNIKKGKSFTLDNFNILDMWNRGSNFVPIIYLDGISNKFNIKLKN